METTTIEVSLEEWQRLNALKKPGDSFKDVVRRLLDQHDQAARFSEFEPDRDPDGVDVECHHCGYSWQYGGAASMATCPSCSRKTPIE